MTKTAYKLFRKKKSGDITSLFINKTKTLEYDVWMKAELHHYTPGFKYRPFWHCTEKPEAPHLSMKGRIWLKVEMEDFEEYLRPDNQGGKWFLAKNIKILK